MLSVQSIWDVVKPNDRLLYILPDVQDYLTIPLKFLSEFRKTISSIFKQPIQYIVFASFYPIQDFINYEQFYGLHFQEIEDLSVFKDPLFQTYLNSKTGYFIHSNLASVLDASLFDRIIVDDLKFTKDQFDELQKTHIPFSIGKCYSEETINAKLYMGKIIQRLVHRSPEDVMDNDVTLIFGKIMRGKIEEYKEILFSYLKENRITSIYSCNTTVLNSIRQWIKELKMKVPTLLLPVAITIDQYTTFLNKLQRQNIHYTSFVFIGEFEFASDDIRSRWKKDKMFLKNNSLYDVDAIHTLIQEDFTEDSGFRLTLNPRDLLKMYYDLSNDDVIEMASFEE